MSFFFNYPVVAKRALVESYQEKCATKVVLKIYASDQIANLEIYLRRINEKYQSLIIVHLF